MDHWYATKENKKLRGAIIYDGTDHIKITLWEDQLDKSFKEKTQWYIATDVNVRNYYGSNLTTSINSKITECNGEKLNWDAVDIEFYNHVIKDRESMFRKSENLFQGNFKCVSRFILLVAQINLAAKKLSLYQGRNLCIA